MKLEVKDNLESAYGLARVLVLYARDKSYADRLAGSQILKDLLKLVRTNVKRKTVIEALRTSVILIFRYCFETSRMAENIMNIEVTALFNNPIRQIKDLHACLRESAPLVFRDIDMAVGVICNNILLEGYTGEESYLSKIAIRKRKNDELLQDVEMSEPEESKPLVSTTIINQLLSELMSAIKTDWLSDPSTVEEKRYKKSTVDLFANESFRMYVFFLKQ